MSRTLAAVQHPRLELAHQRLLVERLQLLVELAVDPRHLLHERHRVAGEGPRVVDQHQVPLGVHQQVAGVPVDVRDQVVERPLAQDLLHPARRRSRPCDWSVSLRSLQPSTQSCSEARLDADAPFDRRRDHVEAEDAVELVGRDLGLVGLPVARLDARGQVLERGATGEAALGEERLLGLASRRSGCRRSCRSPPSSGTPRTRRSARARPSTRWPARAVPRPALRRPAAPPAAWPERRPAEQVPASRPRAPAKAAVETARPSATSGSVLSHGPSFRGASWRECTPASGSGLMPALPR